MSNHGNSIKLITGNSHSKLAQDVADRLGILLVPTTVKKFSNGETNVKIGSSVRDEDVFIIQSSCPGVNDHFMELLILIHACKIASASRITAVIPCFPYQRQDKKDKSRLPITAKLVANMLTVAGADHIITMDLHASQIQGFFDIPVDNLFTEPIFLRYIKHQIEGWQHAIVVSPDPGGAKRAAGLADKLQLDLAMINRKRTQSGVIEPERMEILVGDVRGKVCILVDDMIDSGHTLTLATNELVEKGAKAVYALVSHGLLADADLTQLGELPLERLVVTNTVDQQGHRLPDGKLVVLDVAATVAESIRRLHNGESISLLFGEHEFMI
ncbi:ribose-phosphate pyrophosphokinase 2 [Calocera cornea HHB12733]|uniref:ribose-phosphate diphosphokinase n=1 Tax=Calocera cornea HHB12733 TaxID=1353952 RepID=A0A165FCN3_9BASI|nr:ribose-phosphate pyrophosphokinase 2 [Calocera cornea HHB12733]